MPLDAGVVPREEVARRLATVECESMLRCLPVNTMLWSNLTGCIASDTRQLQAWDVALWARASEAGELEFDPEAFDRCLERIRTAACTGRPFPIYQACREAFRGQLPDGEACHAEFECQPGSTCAREPATCPGECTPQSALGEPCVGEYSCGEDAQCVSNRCVRLWPEGADCTGGAGRCAEGLRCYVGARGSARCERVDEARAAGLGASCDPQVGPYCPGDLVCACDESICRGDASLTCVEPAAAGEACLGSSPPQCPKGYGCSARGRCEPTLEPGSACVASGVCADGYGCASHPGEGASCRSPGLPGDSCGSWSCVMTLSCVDDVCRAECEAPRGPGVLSLFDL